MRLLIVGKLKGHIGAASRIALARGAKVQQVDEIDLALDSLRSGKGADLIMADINLDIKVLVNSLEKEHFCIPVVACGLETDSEPAVKAIKSGAREYLPLPPDAELIAAVLETVAHEETDFIYSDPSMLKTTKLAEQIAPSDASVLITGESGTGKEVMARFIHHNSKRKDKQFISINCAAIPENLLESELFGHEKGAFTGAVARRIGKFEEANGGTLLLDEVTEMHPLLQAKLLRAIQEREIDRVGGTKPVPINIRIIATSNRDLEEAVKNKEFREDLFFRLNVVPLHLPPLRDRPMDIEKLADHFIKKYTQSNALPLRTLSNTAKKALRQYEWRGNIRELENTMHRAVLLASGDSIEPEVLHISGLKNDTALSKAEPVSADPLEEGVIDNDDNFNPNILVGRSLSDVEQDLIIGTVSHCLGNRTQAAHILGISIRTLRNKLRLYTESGAAVPSPNQIHGDAATMNKEAS
ncbi:MAG TPA: sigma-54-dependent Fis family transcriptional regulator [Holosporales bacterium]|nr:sigma-54-dependent Fis family transcriptional regulator [Holosporales bacterium]